MRKRLIPNSSSQASMDPVMPLAAGPIALALIIGFATERVDAQFTLSTPHLEITQGAEFTVTPTMMNDGTVGGGVYAVCFDPTVISLNGVTNSIFVSAATSLFEVEAQFFELEISSDYYQVAYIPTLVGILYHPPGSNDLFPSHFTAIGTGGEVSPLDLCSLPVVNGETPSFGVDGDAVTPLTDSGSVTIIETFRRGDCNLDAFVDLADAVRVFSTLFDFAGDPAAPFDCADACDANDDGQVDLADGISILSRLFSGGSLPAPNSCDVDSTDDPLGCASSEPCL